MSHTRPLSVFERKEPKKPATTKKLLETLHSPKMKKGAQEFAKLRALLRKHEIESDLEQSLVPSEEDEIDYNEFDEEVQEVTEADYRAMLKEHKESMKSKVRAKLGKRWSAKKVLTYLFTA